jgi:hypothetical protein
LFVFGRIDGGLHLLTKVNFYRTSVPRRNFFARIFPH